MKPQAASCAVGSELGLLFTFHKSSEPINRGCKILGPSFYYSSDTLALSLHVELPLDILFSREMGKDTLSDSLVSYFFFFEMHICVCVRVCLLLHTSGCYFMKDDQMTR